MKSMMMIVLALHSFPFLASAQTAAKPVKKTQFELSLEQARRDLEWISAQKIIATDRCELEFLEVQKQNAEWFLSSETQFREAYFRSEQFLEKLNAKVKYIQSALVDTVPLQGQTEEQAQLSFSKLVQYFKIYNSRIQSCSAEYRKDLDRQMEIPALNQLHLAHSQVVVAMTTLSQHLNSSLKESADSFALSFNENKCGFDIRIKISSNGREASFSFLEGDLEHYFLNASTEEGRWMLAMIYFNAPRARGVEKFKEFYQKYIATGCESKWKEITQGSNNGFYYSFPRVSDHQ